MEGDIFTFIRKVFFIIMSLMSNERRITSEI